MIVKNFGVCVALFRASCGFVGGKLDERLGLGALGRRGEGAVVRLELALCAVRCCSASLDLRRE